MNAKDHNDIIFTTLFELFYTLTGQNDNQMTNLVNIPLNQTTCIILALFEDKQ